MTLSESALLYCHHVSNDDGSKNFINILVLYLGSLSYDIYEIKWFVGKYTTKWTLGGKNAEPWMLIQTFHCFLVLIYSI